MSLKITDLEPKQPWEIVPYQLDLRKNSAFTENAETISGVGFAIYVSTDDPVTFTDLASTMQYAASYSGTIIQCDTQSGDSGLAYILRGRVTCTSGRRYEVQGRFTVKEI